MTAFAEWVTRELDLAVRFGPLPHLTYGYDEQDPDDPCAGHLWDPDCETCP